MAGHPYLNIRQRTEQRQVMTLAVHQALQILQMPQLELAERLWAEIEMNPVLEMIDAPRSFSGSRPLDPLIAAVPTLRDHLLRQARETFSTAVDVRIAEYLIGQMDGRGWITDPLDGTPFERESVLRVLLIVQTFDPPGVGARHLQESLWLQLRSRSCSLAESIARDHFDDLLHGRFALIQKRLKLSQADLQKALHHISQLSLRPASKFDSIANRALAPDLTIREIDPGWQLEIGAQELPPIQIREEYAELIPRLDQNAEKRQLRGWIASAKWLKRCLRRRSDILTTIGRLLIQKQQAFFSLGKAIIPMDIRELSQILNVHISTAWRAVSGKTVACPCGMIALRQFFSESKASPVKEIIHSIVQSEDKSEPLTDEEIMKNLHEKGIRCARRTVTKYRRSLQIAAAARRKVIR